jgi:uncharacterized protein (TIGR03437 family)
MLDARWAAWFLALPAVWGQGFNFNPEVFYPAQNGPMSTASADFDGDGNLDIAVGNAASSSISIFLGHGDGTFTAGQVVNVSPCIASYVSAGDFNGDGLPDLLAVCGFQTSVWVAVNKGGGNFAPAVQTQLPELAYQGWAIFTLFGGAAVADFNNDGKLDLELTLGPQTFSASWTMELLVGNGDGTFKPPTPILAEQFTQPLNIAAADVNGDGNQDLVVAVSQLQIGNPDLGGGTLNILLGDGHGSFQALSSFNPLQSTPDVGSLIVADFDQDGIPDVAVVGADLASSNLETSVLEIFKGKGDGTFQEIYSQNQGVAVVQLIAGDFRGTGKLDLFASVIDPRASVFELEFLAGNGDGTFQAPVEIQLDPAAFPWLFSATAGDWNNDGLPDLAFPAIPNIKSADFGESASGMNLAFLPQGWADLPAGDLAIMLNGSPPPPPLIRSVVNGASFKPGIEAGSWVSIFGAHLASDARAWKTSDFNGVNLPQGLDGTSVTIDGKSASVFYINPSQLDVQAPSDSATGPVSVVVTHKGLMSAPFTAQLQPYSPAFFLYAGTSYAIATHLDFSIIGNPAVTPGATPAKPNEVIILWGTGFGETSPPTPAGILFSGAPAAATLSTVTVGGMVASNVGTVLSPGSVGLYQIAVQLPAALPSGPVAVQASAGGASSPTGILIFIANP